MKKFAVLVFGSFVVLASSSGQDTNSVEELRKQLSEMQERFERSKREQQEQINEVSRRIEMLAAQANLPASNAQVTVSSKPTGSSDPSVPDDRPIAPASVSLPLQTRNGRAYLDVGLVGTFAAGASTADDIADGLQVGGHDPNQNGFTVQGVKASFSGAVDPYFRGNANVLFSVNGDGESFVELEEAWLETVSLPGQLQLRAGQILTEFGRQNPTHPHSWAYVDTPLVLGRMFGADGLRNPGARLSWLAPTPFYSELMLSVQDSHGETAYSFRSAGHTHGDGEDESLPFAYRHADNDRGIQHFQDLLLTPRYALSFDLSDSQTVLFGASAAFGPNSRGADGDTDAQIYGLDFTWKWKSPTHHAGFPFVAFQTEALLRRYGVGTFDWDENGNGMSDDGEITDVSTGLPAVLKEETLTDYGFYSQIQYGFRKGWVAGLRFDYVTGEKGDYEQQPLTWDGELLGRDPLRNTRWRLSPNLTWYPSEFSKIRLQYNYDDRRDIGEDHSVWLQFEFLLGAHAAHQF